ncbi:hypothetical protein QIW46_21250 [Pseudomonas fluorescens]|jgi:hypothetical protein|uniref:hypothetical protein n=1 Tax=Pseudomonas fluorescens group TaxID=136843 RepID=UPI0009847BBB|nr:hypothetical protein [Pseudomonas koreensis]OOH78709.1 hypothetical protein BOW65_18505 [Pseudomonas koreensis]WRH90786.1 hypothetical protein RCC30_19000 [Pseudomonas fluorescens]
MVSHEQIVDFSNRLTNGKDEAEAFRDVMKFLCAGIGMVLQDEQVSPIVRDAFAVAHRYWFEGAENDHELNAARIKCWGFLEAKGRDVEIEDNEDAAVRALFCVMYPDRVSDEDFVQESFDWFFEMINRIGDFGRAFEQAAARVTRTVE